MKRVVSVSIGSALRNHRVETDLLGEHYIIERIGTNGDIHKAIDLIKSMDGKVDAFGLGGIDLYLAGADKRFMIKEAIPIVNAAAKTPIVDGTGLKNTLEKNVIETLNRQRVISFNDQKVLLVCAIDRFKMAEAFINMGCDTVLGDLIFALGIPVPIKSLRVFRRVVNVLLPIVSRLPYEILYPVGDKQDADLKSGKFDKYYDEADIIAGDFLYIKKHLPLYLHNKIIITNTVTKEDIDLLKDRGVSILITSTPEFDGRSFGTNVMEAVLVAASGKRPEELNTQDYFDLLKKLNFMPRIEYLNHTEKIDEGKAR
ncbi:quinate 5-dehydrogenase [Petroclostridium sp. X23]|uniref:quinate 5-dehydrogenase n=1 Tax=Petroclostridium sp. X23 TaxID=3045146 RepID=UPI0024ADF67C|nr:quinate 5-dehydrogenase [Petroclostridium sp. X23]WHH58877.1 quinate 5-dehydrogenase [Petroclostridium sp. X23]